jgi:hypothetical protein
MNPLNNIIRTAPMAACAKVQFDLIAEIQRQRAQLAKWDIEAKYIELQEKIHAADKKDYNSRTIKQALDRHHRK